MECHFPSPISTLSAKMIFSFFIGRKKGILSAAFDNLMLLLWQ